MNDAAVVRIAAALEKIAAVQTHQARAIHRHARDWKCGQRGCPVCSRLSAETAAREKKS